MRKRLELDVAYEDSIDEMLAVWRDVCPSVETRVIDENGGGGGWPIVEFVAAEDDLREFLMTYGVMDPELELFLQRAEDVD